MTVTRRKPSYLKIALIALLLLGAAVLLILFLGRPQAQREDYRRISSEKYDTVFLSMYPADTYREEDFMTYREMAVFKASYRIPKFSVLEQYMKRIAKSGNTIVTVYLGIRPDLTDMGQLQSLLDLYPSVGFEVILPYPSLDYWRGLSQEEYDGTLAAYCDFLAAAPDIANAHFYFMGWEEWLAANPGNYEDEWLVNESVATTIMLHSDIFHEYLVTADNAALFSRNLADLTDKARTSPESLPDLSDYRIVFFGDSVIGNYTDSTSIPGVAAGLTGATVFNCGFGGNSATVNPDSPINLPGIAQAFVQEDLSMLPEDTQVYNGMSAYLEAGSTDQKLCVVINYGLNDYFAGYAIASADDPYDVATFCGAIRTTVDTIRSGYPDALIVLCTPTYCFYFSEGLEPRGEEGYILEDYVDAVRALSRELPVALLDTYQDFGVNSENWDAYLLPDQVHPNETYRYMIGKEIVKLIQIE